MVWCLLGFVALLVIAAILLPVFMRSRESCGPITCLSNLKQIALGMRMYARDWDGRLPDSACWQDQLDPCIKNRQVYSCLDGEQGRGTTYAMNPRLRGKKASDFPKPDEVIAFYDADEFGRPVARHHGGTNCAFLDGHAKWMRGVPGDLGLSTSAAPPPRTGSRK